MDKQISYMKLIGLHSTMHLVHPNHCNYLVRTCVYNYVYVCEYCIAGNFKGENFHRLVRSDHFMEKTFVEC